MRQDGRRRGPGTTIRGERVVLRSVRESDLAALYLLINEHSSQGELLALPLRSEPSFRKEFEETGFLDRQRGRLLVADHDDRVLGTIVYFRVNVRDGFEIGYHLFDAASRNRGVMSEALRLAIGYLFSRHRIARLQIVTAPENEASIRLARKCGFRFEGTLRGTLFHAGSSHDSLLFSLLRADASG